MGKLTPLDKCIIIWGKHRTEELLALDIKDNMQNNESLKDKIILAEHQLWEHCDYIPWLRRLIETGSGGIDGKDTETTYEEERDYFPARFLKGYTDYYPLDFHDGTITEKDKSTEIWINIPDYYFEKLNPILKELINKNKFPLIINKDHFLRNEDITIEFMVPEQIKIWPSKEVEELFNKGYTQREFDVKDHSGDNRWYYIWMRRDSPNLYKIPDKANPLYSKILEEYTLFMIKFIDTLIP